MGEVIDTQNLLHLRLPSPGVEAKQLPQGSPVPERTLGKLTTPDLRFGAREGELLGSSGRSSEWRLKPPDKDHISPNPRPQGFLDPGKSKTSVVGAGETSVYTSGYVWPTPEASGSIFGVFLRRLRVCDGRRRGSGAG